MRIGTMIGPIPPERLGVTPMPEHALCDLCELGGCVKSNSVLVDEELTGEEFAIFRDS